MSLWLYIWSWAVQHWSMLRACTSCRDPTKSSFDTKGEKGSVNNACLHTGPTWELLEGCPLDTHSGFKPTVCVCLLLNTLRFYQMTVYGSHELVLVHHATNCERETERMED
ncbi:hypothetical protein B0H66DRAFT_354072 [Apodospora peruviana]|uniref:Secreted protein n=1 Tax=Apodospora peruviana TaxID=516989 RepID=A0AAE0LZI4_9PEZI|nr:hypothetical protein B0H66DRAFT_354072 [Apodospora peruviana]